MTPHCINKLGVFPNPTVHKSHIEFYFSVAQASLALWDGLKHSAESLVSGLHNVNEDIRDSLSQKQHMHHVLQLTKLLASPVQNP